jgi:aminodeoxyfutalosine deaminase
MILKAKFVAPVEGPIIEHGAVAIHRGIITGVGTAQEVGDGPLPKGRGVGVSSFGRVNDAVIDYGDAVICPGFVNAHTHFELSHLVNRVPPSADFTDWLRRLMKEVTVHPPEIARIKQAMRDGIEQSLRAGVTTVGDITRFPHWTRAALTESPLRAVSFGEIVAVGTRRTLLTERLDAACDAFYAGDRLRIGLSPHAPYTVEPEAMRVCADRAAESNASLCIHLAETADEDAFTRLRSGPFVDYLKSLGIWDEDIPTSGVGPVELADRAGLLTPRTIAAHANYVSDADLERLAVSGASVAYCPRTHHAFAHRPHRFRDMLAAGINVCIATDSLASNPSLSVLDELRFVHRTHIDVPVEAILAMGTLHGAKALAMDHQVGSIRTGKRADLAVVAIHPGTPSPLNALLSDGSLPIATFINGNPVWSRNQDVGPKPPT